MNDTRNSNHELMRIISMFLIVLGHVLLFGKLLDTTNKTVNIIYMFIEFTLIVHVNSFILVSGYYQSTSKFKQSKLWKLINANWFYRVVIMILFSSLGIISISKGQLFKDIFPIPLDNYWFIKTYILLYCSSPFINKMINSMNQKEYQKLLLVGFLMMCVIPNITAGEFFDNSGYTLYNFIYLYIIGAYLKKYPLNKSYYFKKFSSELYKIILLIIFFTCAVLNNIIFSFGKEIIGINSILDMLANSIMTSSLAYSNPIIIIQSVAYFSFFTALNFKSKFINKYSGLMFGVYLIHENNYMRMNIYTWLGLLSENANNISFIPYVLLMTIVIFIACSIIEYVRQLIFTFISNRKFAKKIKEKYYRLIDNIYIKNN